MYTTSKTEALTALAETFNTPVLLIIFNRPEKTKRVFEAIKNQKPKFLYVAADGPRPGNAEDIEKCKAARDVILVDWDCEFHTLYCDENRGCGKGPAEAITWFFENVDEGIIIEDDSIPAPDFFMYAQILLHKFKNDTRIKVIGSMHLDENWFGDGSYYYSMMNRNLCCWATWRRAWSDFDFYLSDLSEKKLIEDLKFYNVRLREREYWCDRLEEIQTGRLIKSSWDIQFLMSLWINKGIGICSNVNLSTNIGFDSEGTHTISPESKAANLAVGSILPIVHPSEIGVNRNADLNYHIKYFQPGEYGASGLRRLPYRINRRLKKLLHHKGSWIKK